MGSYLHHIRMLPQLCAHLLALLTPAGALPALLGGMVAPTRLLPALLLGADAQPIAAARGYVGDGRIADPADAGGIVVLGR